MRVRSIVVTSLSAMPRFVRHGELALLTLTLACGAGTEPNGTGPVGPIGPFPAGVTGKVAFATEVVITTSTRAYIESKVHVIDVANPVDSVIYTGQDLFVQGLTWAPDGQHLVMQTYTFRDPGPNGENRDISQLHRLNLAGSENYPIFDGVGPEFRPAYSTTGRLAYFGGWSNDPASGIYIDGAPAHSLDYSSSQLAWAPDGSALVYTFMWWSGPPRGLVRLSLVDDSITQLVAPDTGEVIAQPAYSPDGAHIAIMRYGGDHVGGEIWTVTATGDNAQRLTTGGSPGWTPGGAHIVFARFDRSASGIYLIPPGGGTAQRVVGIDSRLGLTALAWSQ